MADKDELLRDANEAYADLTRAVAGLGEGDASRVWLGTWGVREILIHIAGWNREMAPALARIGNGEPPYPDGQYDDADGWNARFAAARQGVPLNQILAELEESHREIMAAASALSDAHLAPDAPARAIFDGTVPQHYREHAAQIRGWRTAPAGVAR